MMRPQAPRPGAIVDLLRTKINSGEFAEGAKLPGEATLADLLHTSRSIVRRALVELAREGLVSAARGRGTFVRMRPERRTILISGPVDGDQSGHEDLLAADYRATRGGWMPVSPWPGRAAGPVHAAGAGAAAVAAGAARGPEARIVACAADMAETLGIEPDQPVVRREQRWRHQENGSIIALTSVTPLSLFAHADDQARAAYDGGGVVDSADGDGGPDPDQPIAVYPALALRHGPVSFHTAVGARMPNAGERVELEMEVGVPLLVVTRTMLGAAGRPLEATVVYAPADRFGVADACPRPIIQF